MLEEYRKLYLQEIEEMRNSGIMTREEYLDAKKALQRSSDEGLTPDDDSV